MTYEHVVNVLELITAALTYVTMTLLAVVVLLIVLPRLVAHLLTRVADDPVMQHGLAIIRRAVREGGTWLVHQLIAVLVMALHWLIMLYTSQQPAPHGPRYVKQTDAPDDPSAPSPDEPSGASTSQTAHGQTDGFDPAPSLMLDIIARVRRERTKESVMLFLLAADWSTENIRSVLKGDTNVLTQQIAALRAELRDMREARLRHAQQQLARERDEKEVRA